MLDITSCGPHPAIGHAITQHTYRTGMPYVASREPFTWDGHPPGDPSPFHYAPFEPHWDVALKKGTRMTLDPRKWADRQLRLNASYSAQAACAVRSKVVAYGAHIGHKHLDDEYRENNLDNAGSKNNNANRVKINCRRGKGVPHT